MDKRSIREDATLYFVPFLLDNNRVSHKLSLKIFFKYGISSVIISKKRGVFDLLDFSSRPICVLDSKSSALLCEELIALADQAPYTLPLLIPCSKEYERAINEHREALEKHFVISNPKDVFSSSPLTTIP